MTATSHLGVKLVIGLLQLWSGDVGVDLGSRNVFMAQHLLHIAQTCPVTQEIGGKAMSNPMRTEFDWEFGLPTIEINQSLNTS